MRIFCVLPWIIKDFLLCLGVIDFCSFLTSQAEGAE